MRATAILYLIIYCGGRKYLPFALFNKKCMEFLIAGIVAAVSSLLAYGISSKQQESQFELNSSLMDKQAGLNRDQYDYEFSHESPAARVAQYHAANLNPGLMYSNGVAGMQGSVGTVSGSSVGLPALSSLSDIGDAMLNISSSREKEGKTAPSQLKMSLDESFLKLTDKQIVGEELSNEWQTYENAWKKVDSDIKAKNAPEIAEIDLKTRRESFDKLCAETISVMNDNSLQPERREQMQNALKIQTEQILTMQAERALTEAKTRLTDQQIEEIRQKLPYEIDLLMEQYANTVAKTQGQYIDNAYYQKVLDDYDVTWWNNVLSSYLSGLPLGEALKFAVTKKP